MLKYGDVYLSMLTNVKVGLYYLTYVTHVYHTLTTQHTVDLRVAAGLYDGKNQGQLSHERLLTMVWVGVRFSAV